MSYKRKTRDAYAIEVNYGFGDGWEHEVTEYTRTERNERLNEYRANAPQWPVRARKFREPLESAS